MLLLVVAFQMCTRPQMCVLLARFDARLTARNLEWVIIDIVITSKLLG